MRPLFGPRTVVEAAFLVAVPVIALAAGLSWYAIIGAGAVAYLLVLAVEAAIWRDGKKGEGRRPLRRPAAAVDSPPPQADVAPVAVVTPEPEVHLEPVPAPPPRPEPVPPPPPEPIPLPVPKPAPEPPPPAAAIIPIPTSSAPRQWNVWDLEQLAREHSGGDLFADEERTFLLLYLRDFAGPDGLLPVDFDDLVRQSFGALVANR